MASPMSSTSAPPSRRPVALWLFVCLGLVFAMVVLGGVTRLTHSGLSMVEWRPVTGWLPPLSEDAWQAEFEKYRQYPEFLKLNPDMDLAGFQGIYWLEYLHRLLGRTLGLAFLVPLVWFWARGQIGRDLWPKLFAIFVLGGLQGGLGWFMVASGLVDYPDVSAYRLTAHLGLAVAIFAWILWLALDLIEPRAPRLPPAETRVLRRAGGATLALVVAAILAGGLVAGTDAGFAYNTFPLMGERLFPDGYALLEPFHLNLFENVVAVQFNHRLLAALAAAAILGLWLYARRRALPPRHARAVDALALAGAAQFALGVAALVLIVPVPLGAAHQGGALVLLAAALVLLHGLRRAEG
ncbi:MAG: COX15/CtaA family protein [Proteobacteria bacterium]|nr:COX15/CtaA family protein [Pseudomonadota bacterium]